MSVELRPISGVDYGVEKIIVLQNVRVREGNRDDNRSIWQKEFLQLLLNGVPMDIKV
jgi:hypothetical protein